MQFDLCIGIDYSGAETPTSRLKGLQVYTAQPGAAAAKKFSPTTSGTGKPCNWSRKELATWLIDLAKGNVRFIAGIDHCFSFPLTYFERHGLTSWPQFLDDFVRHWPTDRDDISVELIRTGVIRDRPDWPGPGLRDGVANELRLCERWTTSAKSVFHFDVQGAVAKSTHAGIPWLKRIRDTVGDRVHVWPFDGWLPPESKSLIAEVYPSIFRNRFERDGRTPDEHDAYSVCRWLSELPIRNALARYLDPTLTTEERRVAALEGWILGIG